MPARESILGSLQLGSLHTICLKSHLAGEKCIHMRMELRIGNLQSILLEANSAGLLVDTWAVHVQDFGSKLAAQRVHQLLLPAEGYAQAGRDSLWVAGD